MWQPSSLPVDHGGAFPHSQISRILRDALARRELVVGDRLPPERDLASGFGVSRMTIRRALEVLEEDGVVERRRGRNGGTFIAEARVEVSGLVALSEHLRGLGVRSGIRVVDARIRLATGDELATLGVTTVYAIHRLRYAGGRVVSLERTVLPTEPYPGLLDHPLAGSLYRLLADAYDGAPVRAVERLLASTVRPEEASSLEVAVGAPVLLVRRVGYESTGRARELSHDLYRVDRTRVMWEFGVDSRPARSVHGDATAGAARHA